MQIVETPSVQRVSPFPETVLRNSIMGTGINGETEINEGTIFARALVVGAQTWIHNLTWTPTDYNTASWSSGVLQFADGNSYTINSGNTGNISGVVYIYFNGSETLQVTSTYSDSISDEHVLIAIVAPADTSDGAAIITAFNSNGTTIDGDKVVTGRIESSDGRTYFDLDLNRIVMSDGSTNRLVIGNV